MKISLIGFTSNGAKLCRDISLSLSSEKHVVKSFAVGSFEKVIEVQFLNEPLMKWSERQFEEADGIVFIGAAGIAVRTIAPFIKDKTKDPAVIVIDEKGKFVIPILSGHLGGANDLAIDIARLIGSIPVITTATDINDRLAVDLFAKKNCMHISRMDYAKKISAAILNGKEIGFISDFSITDSLPSFLSRSLECEYGICISLDEKKKPFSKTLNLIPNIVTLGIGCRKGKTLKEIEEVLFKVLYMNCISIHAVETVSSIDLKSEEMGLLEFCKKYNLKFRTYSARELERVPGEYSESEYVKTVTGIGNVCERAAVISGGRTLIQKKYAENGITVSIARKDWSVRF